MEQYSKKDIFWFKGERGGIGIDYEAYANYIHKLGYRITFGKREDEEAILLKSENYVVHQTHRDRLIVEVMDFVKSFKDPKLKHKIATYPKIFSSQFFKCNLEVIKLDEIKATISTDYMFFKNGVLGITKDKLQLKKYSEIKKYVWKDNIIDHNFSFVKDHTNDYQRFLHIVAGEKSIDAFETSFGYLLSRYNDPANPRCVILNDLNMDDDSKGGSGKDLLGEGLDKARNVEPIDGKRLDMRKSFEFSGVTHKTDIVRIFDLKRFFNLEELFVMLTNGFKVEGKGKNSYMIPPQDAPKILLSSNFVVKGSDDSSLRRRYDLELQKVYGKDRKPIDDFGKRFFDEWDNNEWNAFYNYMPSLIQKFLRIGVVEQDNESVDYRRTIDESSRIFFDWANDNLVPRDMPYGANEMLSSFLVKNSIEYEGTGIKKPTNRLFTNWIKSWCNYWGYQFDNNEVRTNGRNRGFIISGEKSYKRKQEAIDRENAMTGGFRKSNAKSLPEKDIDTSPPDLPF